MQKWRWVLANLGRRLWVRTALFGVLGVLAAIVATLAEQVLPPDWQTPVEISVQAVDGLLTIIASSMLAVTTFSLSTMVSAYGSATSNVTPRATKLLMEDRLTQSVLSTFVGSFLFGIVGLIVLRTGAYGDRGRVVLFVLTIAVIALVVFALLRWIDHLTRLGRVGETTNLVEQAALQAIEQRLQAPYLGGTALRDEDQQRFADATPLLAHAYGYVQNVDMPLLSRLCEERNMDLALYAVPGTFVFNDTPLVAATAALTDEDAELIREAFSIATERSFDQDPRFGLAVLAEIGSRALSPATNDPGTAIDVVGRLTRVIGLWGEKRPAADDQEVAFPRVHVPPIATADLFEDAFMIVARDAAGLIEVQLRLQKSLLALSRMGDDDFRAAALDQSRMALERAEASMSSEVDKARLRALVEAG
jgi:uncharacterized membrane protein